MTCSSSSQTPFNSSKQCCSRIHWPRTFFLSCVRFSTTFCPCIFSILSRCCRILVEASVQPALPGFYYHPCLQIPCSHSSCNQEAKSRQQRILKLMNQFQKLPTTKESQVSRPKRVHHSVHLTGHGYQATSGSRREINSEGVQQTQEVQRVHGGNKFLPDITLMLQIVLLREEILKLWVKTLFLTELLF